MNIFNPSSDVNKAKSDLANIEQTLQDLTNNVLRPVISTIFTGINFVKNFIGNFTLSGFIKDITSSVTGAISGAFDKLGKYIRSFLSK
ncbi:hypothetical protein [Borreliella bavariensis]|uniref:hypothetical protein n=1 Tax=Borreliella bavariensis TaxID=664662 RepID=UPI00165E6406|nr:hypothetical protein [Borreliella bavariensis]WLN24789.1 hypothetical protein IDK87_06080 [Borreliella bavariensis]